MQLVLRAIRCPPDSPVQPAHFGPGGGTIGRSPECTLALPDPKRYISRVHAQIRCREGVYTLKVISRVNPVLVNGIPLAHNEAVEIKTGDTLSLGDYELTASLAEDDLYPDVGVMLADPFALLNVPGTTATKPGEDTLRDPFFREKDLQGLAGGLVPGLEKPDHGTGRDLLSEVGGQRSADPLLNILEGKTTPAPAGPFPGGPIPPAAPLTAADESTIDRFLSQGGLGAPGQPGAAAPQKPAGSAAGGLADHGDHVHDLNLPFQPPPVSPKAPALPPAAPAAGPAADIFAELLGTAVPSATPGGTTTAAPPTPPAPAAGEDIFSVLDGLVGQPPQQPRTLSPATAPLPEAAAPPVQAAQPPGVPVQPVAGDERVARLLAKFAEGLGVADLNLAPEDAEAFMAGAGELLRAAIDGIYTLLILRAEVKKELRAEDRTMIASRENNPLKHTESVEEALRYLLEFKNPNPAFLPPVRAMQDAFNDVRAHEMAVMAGMRAGLAGVIKRFDPKALEPRIKKGGALDTVLPSLYKSKLWETYVGMYREIEQEVEDHFDRVFGREFVRAYMEQTKKLRRQSK